MHMVYVWDRKENEWKQNWLNLIKLRFVMTAVGERRGLMQRSNLVVSEYQWERTSSAKSRFLIALIPVQTNTAVRIWIKYWHYLSHHPGYREQGTAICRCRFLRHFAGFSRKRMDSWWYRCCVETGWCVLKIQLGQIWAIKFLQLLTGSKISPWKRSNPAAEKQFIER